MQMGFSLLATAGAYVSVGLVGGRINIPLFPLVAREYTYHGSFWGNYTDLSEVIALAQSGRIKHRDACSLRRHQRITRRSPSGGYHRTATAKTQASPSKRSLQRRRPLGNWIRFSSMPLDSRFAFCSSWYSGKTPCLLAMTCRQRTRKWSEPHSRHGAAGKALCSICSRRKADGPLSAIPRFLEHTARSFWIR
jgi:hypothetical protein